MKVRLYDDVNLFHYTVLTGDTPNHIGKEVEVPEEVAKRWEKTRAEFDQMQREMDECFSKAEQ